MTDFRVPIVARGQVIDGDDCTFAGRGGQATFVSPNAALHLDRLCLTRPSAMMDMYRLRFAEVVDYLDELGGRLQFDTNPYLREAFELSLQTSGLSREILHETYVRMHGVFARDVVTEMADRVIGIGYLDGWVEEELGPGRRVGKRAFGARAVHVIAGNSPGVAAYTILRNAVVRGDAIIKTPSNDPLTAAAIARTMIDMAPDHPLTRHVSVAYWKGGDTAIEELVYQPTRVEKIVAWGGQSSMQHIVKYIQPGIELVSLDPKLSSAIVTQAAFESDAAMLDAAERIALDVGAYNQETCGNARVVYVQSGTDDEGLEKLCQLGEMVWTAMGRLPAHISGPAAQLNPSLEGEIDSLRSISDWHKVFGGGKAGAVIVSLIEEPVDFATKLEKRVANLVPIDELATAVRSVNAYTQTIGIYPDAAIAELRDALSLHGAQRLVSLGYATVDELSQPHDGIEPMRRLCKWISQEIRDPASVPLPSRTQAA